MLLCQTMFSKLFENLSSHLDDEKLFIYFEISLLWAKPLEIY